jgi:hypothetical protein
LCGSCAAGGRLGVAVAHIVVIGWLDRRPRAVAAGWAAEACVLGGVGVVAPARKCRILVGLGVVPGCGGFGGMTLYANGIEVAR